MEAVPKLAFIGFELKVSPENTHFGPKLKQYIAEAYREDPESYGNEIHQLEGLRSAAVRPTIDAAGLKALNRYFCQLRAMQSRFPMAKGQPAACTFVWKDLYANMNCSLADLKFEMACILYNIGALHTQLAASEPRTSADSLKVACQHFQNAAWAFQYLREQYPQPSGADVSSEILKLLIEICFAQAQECILDKSRQDTRKPSVIGAVATQVLHFYKNSLAILGPSTGTDNIHEIIGTKLYNNWFRYLSFKAYYIGCIVCLYQGINAEEQQKMGERVAYYQQAVDKLNEANKLAKYIDPVQVTQEALTFTNDIVEGKRKAAKNENEFIYHEEVPEKDMLSDLKPVCLVKAVAINFSDPEVSGPDIFSRLVPIGAHEASSLYSEEKAKLLRHVVAQVEAKDLELTEFMSSLQLDQLDVLDEEETVPQEVVDRCAAMNAKPDMVSSLVDSMNSLAELIGDVEHALADARALVQEEGQLEKEYQKAVGPRGPSLVQTELARELHKYGEAHARARDSSQVLHKAMTLHVANLQLLALPLAALRRKIPSVAGVEGLDRSTMGEMRRVLGKAREMRAQRAALLAALREALAADDVTALLLADPQQPRDQLFRREIEKHTPKVKIIEQNLSAQENVINRLTALYAAYGDSRRLLADVLRRRDATLHALVTSYDSFDELLSKSAKGLEFYRKLHHNLGALLARARATCQVQREERDRVRASGAAAASPAAPGAPAAPGPPPAAGAAPKLKDYLPYMKNRSLARNAPPQVPMEMRPADPYPDPAGPTSARPAPVGSEDMSRAGLPDGGAPGHARAPGAAAYAPTDYDSYVNKYNYSADQPFNKSQEMQNYNYSGTSQPQFAAPAPEPPGYAQPHPGADVAYHASRDMSRAFSQMHVTAPAAGGAGGAGAAGGAGGEYAQTYFSVHYPPSACNVATYSHAPQNLNTNSTTHQSSQYSMNYPYTAVGNEYGQTVPNQPTSAPDVSNSFANYSQAPPNIHGSYPAISNPAPNSFQSYSEASNGTYPGAPDAGAGAAVCYPNAADPNAYLPPVASSDGNINMSGAMSHRIASGSNSTVSGPSSGEQQFSYTPGGAYSGVAAFSSGPGYGLATDSATYVNPALAQIDELDKPIKSHAKGEALSGMPISSYQNFNMSAAVNYNPERAGGGAQYGEGRQPSQNHPGYTYNACTGNYDYSYGSQNSYSYYEQQANVDPQTIHQDPSWNGTGVYTSAGAYSTVQSPSEAPQSGTLSQQTYYHPPYGYQTATSQSPEGSLPAASPGVPPAAPAANEATAAKENFNETPIKAQYSEPVPSPKEEPAPPAPELPAAVGGEGAEPTALDLLSDIDFSIEQKPLLPEIKVPQISEKAVIKSTPTPRVEAVRPAPEEPVERPPERDLFSDPCLVNQFTQEVKNLQKLTDSLTIRTPDGLTLLDSKWKHLQEVQAKENMNRSKSIAMRRSRSIATDVLPYDDSRLTLESDPDAYINASFYKQLAPWCIPLVISKCPDEADAEIFWKAVYENKISCIVCLLTEVEVRGAAYWPTAPGQTLRRGALAVTLEDARRAAHWTERRLRLQPARGAAARGAAARGAPARVAHFQLAAFPAKVLCAPLVQLSDAVLRAAAGREAAGREAAGRAEREAAGRAAREAAGRAARGGAWLHCGAGAGRSALLALLIMLMCQVRAGYVNLTETLEAGCAALARARAGVLAGGGPAGGGLAGGGPAGGGPAGGGLAGGGPAGSVLADAYRSALFYAQGVLCSGSTLFNGEAVSLPSGAGVPPPAPGARALVAPAPTGAPGAQRAKFSRESFEEMRQAPGLTSGDMKDPLNFLDPLWTLKKK